MRIFCLCLVVAAAGHLPPSSTQASPLSHHLKGHVRAHRRPHQPAAARPLTWPANGREELQEPQFAAGSRADDDATREAVAAKPAASRRRVYARQVAAGQSPITTSAARSRRRAALRSGTSDTSRARGHAPEPGVSTAADSAPAGAGPKEADLRHIFGRLHGVLAHLPIGWLFGLLVAETSALCFGQFRLAGAGVYLLLGTVAVFGPALLSGFCHPLAGGSVWPADAIVHRNALGGASALLLVATGLRLWSFQSAHRARKLAYLVLLLLANLLVGIGVYAGYVLAHGSPLPA